MGLSSFSEHFSFVLLMSSGNEERISINSIDDGVTHRCIGEADAESIKFFFVSPKIQYIEIYSNTS